MIRSKQRVKTAYDNHRHSQTKYTVGEVVVMTRVPVSTGESTKLQERYRGPLVVTEVLPNDTYQVAQLAENSRQCFATTAHVSQLKLWKIGKEEPDVSEGRMTTSEELSKETEDIPGEAKAITKQDEERSTDVRRSERNQKWGTNKYRPQFTKWIVSESVVVTSEEDSGFLESAFRGRDYSPVEGCEESNARKLQIKNFDKVHYKKKFGSN
ncbi:hypothetical protein QTP88_019147 [Uroleucon formosanum]